MFLSRALNFGLRVTVIEFGNIGLKASYMSDEIIE
jgi:hypothetical protein